MRPLTMRLCGHCGLNPIGNYLTESTLCTHCYMAGYPEPKPAADDDVPVFDRGDDEATLLDEDER